MLDEQTFICTSDRFSFENELEYHKGELQTLATFYMLCKKPCLHMNTMHTSDYKFPIHLFSNTCLPIYVWTRYNQHLHFLAVQQHAIHFDYSFLCTFFSLKMHKSIAFGALLIISHLQKENSCREQLC